MTAMALPSMGTTAMRWWFSLVLSWLSQTSVSAGIVERGQVDRVALAESADRSGVGAGQYVAVVDHRLVELQRARSCKRYVLIEDIGEMGEAAAGDDHISGAVDGRVGVREDRAAVGFERRVVVNGAEQIEIGAGAHLHEGAVQRHVAKGQRHAAVDDHRAVVDRRIVIDGGVAGDGDGPRGKEVDVGVAVVRGRYHQIVGEAAEGDCRAVGADRRGERR